MPRDSVGDVLFALPEVLHVVADDRAGAGGVHLLPGCVGGGV